MAELDDAIRAFRNAHAAGDTAAATTLAKYIQQLEAQAPAPGGPFASLYEVSASPETPEGPTISGEFGRGLESLLSSLRTTGAAAFGDEEEAALAGLERQRQIGEEYGEGPSLESVLRTYEEDGLLSAVGEAGSQILPAVSGQLPIWAALGAGAMAGQAAIPVPILGGALGAAAVGLPMFFGSNVERQAETQLAEGRPVDISTGRALAAAAGQTALESAGAAATFGKGIVKSILKIADDTQLDSAAARDLTGAALAKLRGEAATPVTMGARAGAAGRGALTAAAVEMPTEVAQQVIERAQAGLDVLSPEAFAEYGEAAYLAGIAGGTLGGATRVGEPGRVQRRAETRLRDVAEQEAQDLFAAERERQGEGGVPAGMQPDLFGEIAPVMAPQTRAGEAQQEELRLQEQQREVYRTRGGEERFAPPGTFAPTELPNLMEKRDQDVFDYMKSQGLTQATALETLPTKPDNEERIAFNNLKTQMNEQLVMAAAAAEAPRIPVPPGATPLTLDPTKRIADLTPEERSVFDRAVEAVRARRQAGTLGKDKGQQRLPKALTDILVGEEATVAKAEEAAAQLERDRKAEDRAQKQADREAEKAQAAAAKLNAQRAKAVQDPRRQQALELGEPVDLVRPVPEDAGVSADSDQIDLFAPTVAPTAPATQRAAPAVPKFPTTREERVALAKEVGLNPSLAMVRNDNGILAQYANQDLTDPAVAARLVEDLETAKKAFKGDYADRNSAAVDTLIARFSPKQAETPAVDAGTITIPTGKSGKVTQSVPRYWYHSLRGRQLGPEGQILPYSRGKETETLLSEGFKNPPAGAVYLSPTPLDGEAVRIDGSKLNPNLMRTTGQAEGYAIYAGEIPASAIETGVDELAGGATEIVEPTVGVKPKAEPKSKKPKTIKKYTEDDFYGDGVSDIDGTEALISFFERDPANPSLQKLVKESIKWVDDPVAKTMLTEAAKNIPGLMALENATNSPKLEGDLLAAVQAGDLKKTISLLVGKMSGRPEAQQIMRRIQSLGLKTKIVIAGRPTLVRDELGDPPADVALAVQKGIEGKNALEAANFVASNATDPMHRVIAKAVAQRLRELAKAGTLPDFQVIHIGDRVRLDLHRQGQRGVYDPNNNTVYIKGADITGSVGTTYETVLHELVHAVTVNLMYAGSDPGATDATLIAYAERMTEVRNAVVKHFNARVAESKRGKTKLTEFEQQILRKGVNTFDNVREVIAWALTNPEAQAYMEGIPYQGKNAWTVFVQAVRRVLGLSPSADTALSEVLSVAEGYFGKSAARAATLTARSTPVGASLEGKAGAYDPVTDTITLDSELGLNEHTLIHELSHAALANQIANPNSKVAKDFGKFFEIVKNQLGGTYGGTNVQEFAAEIMGNEQFAAATKAMKAPKGGSLWDKIVQTIAEFFGFRKPQSVYDQAIKYIEELLNVPRTAEPTITEKLFMGTPKSAAEALTSIGKEVRPVTREAQSDFRKLLRKVDGVEPAFEGVYSTALKAAFSLMRLQNIYDIYKDAGSKYTPLSRALKKLSDSLERRLGEIERRSKVFNDKYNGWLKIANDKKYAAHMERMITLANEARRNGIDLVPENKFEPSKEQEQVFNRLKNVLNNLPKPVRDMYLEMRRDYDKEFQANREFLLAQYRDNPTAYAEMKAEFEAKHALKGYIPDMRFGDFVLEYTEAGTNRRVVQQFESRGERAQAIEELKLKDGEYETYSRITEAKYDQKKVPDGSFLRKVMDDLKKTNASQKQLDTVYQAYLSMFPAQSLAKRMMRSENVAGQSRDLLRGYATTMMQWVRHRANAQYSPIIDEALDDIQKQQDVGGVHTKALSDVLNSAGSKDFLHNPTFNPAISFATGVSFGAFILGNVSSALVNLTALPLGWNMLGAKYGYNAARKAMTDATKIITPLSLKDMTGDTNAWNNVPLKYRKLIDAMLDRGQLQHTQTREILEGRGKASAEMGSGVAGVMVKALDLGSRPFNAAEKVNRGAIGIAAYEMARKGGNGVAPMTEAAAIEYAIEVVKNINTSGTAATGPRAFQTAPGRLIGTFKSFALNQVAVFGIAAAKSFMGADPETKRIARRQLLGTYAVSGALAGVAGMPFVTSTVSVLNSVMQGLFGDDDDDYEYFNSQEWMQDVLTDWAYKGPINAFLNLSVADRTAITSNLAPVPDPQLVEDIGYVRAMIIQLAGPAAGVAVNLEKAVTEAREGRWDRVPEYLLPTAGANLFKAARFYRDGADINKDGEPVDDDINTYNAVMQAIGFAPADRALIYQARTMALQFEAEVERHKDQLLDAAWAAFNAGDMETFEEVRGRLVALGRRYPGLVNNDTIERSFRSRTQSIQDSVTGVTLNSSLRPEQIRRFFDDLE